MVDDHNNHRCYSWNCCDENLQACIERSKYVRDIRNQLKKKKLRKINEK